MSSATTSASPPRLESRRHRRVPVPVEVRVSDVDPETDTRTGRRAFRRATGRAANVSRGGLFVHAADPPAPGRRLLVEFELPGGTPVRAIGRVAWSVKTLAPSGDSGRSLATRESGMGVEILGGARDQLAALDEFIDRG